MFLSYNGPNSNDKIKGSINLVEAPKQYGKNSSAHIGPSGR